MTTKTRAGYATAAQAMGERGASQSDAAAMKTAKPKCWLAIAAVELWINVSIDPASSLCSGAGPKPSSEIQRGGASGIQADGEERRQERDDEDRAQPSRSARARTHTPPP